MSIKDVDGHKLNFHPEKVSCWLQEEYINPIHVEIGITNRCNHNCKFCTLSWINHGGSDIPTDIMLKTLNEFKDMGIKSIYFAGEGEPTLHKDFPLFVNKASELGMKVAVSTNGSCFDSSLSMKVIKNLSWMRFSLDSITPETYSKMHGVKKSELFNVLKNITEAVNSKKKTDSKCEIGVQAIFESTNADEMITMGKMLRDIGVDNFQIKPAHSHPKSSYSPGIHDFSDQKLVEDLQNLSTDDFSVMVRLKSLERLSMDRNYTTCHGFHFYGLIDANGNVVPCNIFYNNPEFIYGNINEKSFTEIWKSERRKQIIEKLSKSNNKYCADYRCRLDVLNRYLQRVKYPEANDDFI